MGNVVSDFVNDVLDIYHHDGAGVFAVIGFVIIRCIDCIWWMADVKAIIERLQSPFA